MNPQVVLNGGVKCTVGFLLNSKKLNAQKNLSKQDVNLNQDRYD